MNKEKTAKRIAHTLSVIFKPKIAKKNNGLTSLTDLKHKNYLASITAFSQKYEYFIKLDIQTFYPSIDHRVLVKEIEANYKVLACKKHPSRHMKKIIQNDLPNWLTFSPLGKIGLPAGSRLSFILSEIYLYRLDSILKKQSLPFIRFCDDLVVFVPKNYSSCQKVMEDVILPELTRLNLQPCPRKTYSGKLNRESLDFIGFVYKGGCFSISPNKIERFRKKIIRLTILSRKISREALIKIVNRLVNGFGHFYKFADCKKQFADLDGFIRKRIRRKLVRMRSNNSAANLIFTNRDLSKLGLKSLLEIKDNFDSKKGKKSAKRSKKDPETARRTASQSREELTGNGLFSAIEVHRLELQKLGKDVAELKKDVKSLRKILERMATRLEDKKGGK